MDSGDMSARATRHDMSTRVEANGLPFHRARIEVNGRSPPKVPPLHDVGTLDARVVCHRKLHFEQPVQCRIVVDAQLPPRVHLHEGLDTVPQERMVEPRVEVLFGGHVENSRDRTQLLQLGS
eukprot:4938891-Prymnesium_polylepis.1